MFGTYEANEMCLVKKHVKTSAAMAFIRIVKFDYLKPEISLVLLIST